MSKKERLARPNLARDTLKDLDVTRKALKIYMAKFQQIETQAHETLGITSQIGSEW